MSPDTPAADWLKPLASLSDTSHSFIVIIRHQPNSQTGGWRGSVEHSQTHERVYFVDYARLNAFIASRSETGVHLSWRARLALRPPDMGLHQLLRWLLGGRLRFALPDNATPPD